MRWFPLPTPRPWLCSFPAAGALALIVGVTSTAPSAAVDRELHVPVLMYHRITEAPPGARLPGLWVSPRRFGAHMRALHESGWRSLTAAELSRAVLDGQTVGPKRFVVVFDDGARDGYRHAAPILERVGMVGTFCVVPGRAGRPWQISFEQMRVLRLAGHEIANHTLSHAHLPGLGSRELRRQVRGARRLIARRLGRAPTTFCYPYGAHDARARRAVRAAGHDIAFTTVAGARQTRADRMRVPRIRVNGWDTPAALLDRLQPFAKGGGREPGQSSGPAAHRRVQSPL
jgi:peptidoglycan/xylan/chitin deacetylase (PgdA/CDA1 family)